MKKRAFAVIFIALLFLALLSLSLPNRAPIPAFQAMGGRMELTHLDIERTQTLRLDGEWEFYWNQLLSPADFVAQTPNTPEFTGYITVPSLWNEKEFNGERLPAFGCATYRLILEHPPRDGVLGLKKNNIRFSSKVYVNGKELLSDGVPAERAQDYKSGNTPQVGFFSSNGDNLEIVVQVANYEYPNSGIPISFELGSADTMLHQYQKESWFSIAILALLLTIAFIYFSFFIIAKLNNVSAYLMLFFSVFCLLFALANALTDQRPLLQLFPDIAFGLAFKIKDFLLLANFIVLFWIFHLFKKGLLPLKLIQVVSAIYGAFLIAIVLLPIFIYITVYLFMMACNTAILVLMLIQSIRLYIRKAEGFLIFIAVLAVNFYSMDAILFSVGLKDSSKSLQVYLMIFAAVMVFLLSMQYFTTIRQWQISVKQTQEAEVAFLRAQINPHFLYNALNSVAALCATTPEKAEEVVVELSKYLRRSFDFKSMDAMSTLARELELLEAYLYIEKTRFGDRLKVVYDIDKTLNFLVPPLVLQPLVENAVKHGLMANILGGTVKISIRLEADEYVFTIEDNGIGMEPGKSGQLLEEGTQTGGVGVRNIDRRLKMLYGKGLSVRSEPGRGTLVRFALPLRQKELREKSILPWR